MSGSPVKAGGFGAAIGLLKDLALEVWDRIGLGAASAWSKIEASWAELQATTQRDAVLGRW